MRIVTFRYLLRYLVVFVVLLITLGTFNSKNSAIASIARFWRTVELINGFGAGNVPFPKISSGGRYVVFHSQIDNLVPNDFNNFCDTDGNSVADNSCADIFVYDRQTAAFTLVSVSSTGTQGNGRSSNPSINPDARYITFQSEADNLVPNGSHTCLYYSAILRQCTDIFVHDRNTGITERVSIGFDGIKANGNSDFPGISADGRYVSFSSYANNLIPNGIHICPGTIVTPPTQCSHIFVHDSLTGITERVSVSSNGEKGGKGSYYPSISADGHHVAFLSNASNLVPNDNNGQLDAFVRHLDTGETVLVSISSNGMQANQGVGLNFPAISENGRYVVFVSRSSNLVANDTNGVADVFVRDLQENTTIRTSVASDDSQANAESDTYKPSISVDGRYVLFDSSATNLVTSDTNGYRDVFIRDLLASNTLRVSITQNASQSNHHSIYGAISPDGEFASFISYADNFVPGDFNNMGDIFVAEATNALPFPYFSQKDSTWGGQEYDSANTYGPFFCGATLAQCGCATTSSSMLLKYYGVDKSPTGELTNPKTLNNWLKANNGYAFGALKWNSIASYAFKAWQVYNTQSKIKFTGVGGPNDYSTLDQDLNNNSPPILQQPGHFIVATGIQSPTYSINDPAWENRKTLESYGGSFQSMRRFAKTTTDLSVIYISTPAPTNLLITDSKGNKTGKDADGNTYSDIPNSYYTLEPAFADQSQQNPINPPENEGVNTLVILTPDQKNFTLETFAQSPTFSIEFSGYDEDGDITVANFDQTNADQYDIDYSAGGNHFEFFQTVEIDARHSAKPNPFNPNARILPVSVLASGDFDPQQVDINTIEADGWNFLKTSTILVGPQSDKELLLLLQSESETYSEKVCIRGKTTGGIPFKGCDAVRTVGNGP